MTKEALNALKDAADGNLPLEELEGVKALDDEALEQVAGGYMYQDGKGYWHAEGKDW